MPKRRKIVTPPRNDEAAPEVIVIDSDSDDEPATCSKESVVSSHSEPESTSDDDEFPSLAKILYGSDAKELPRKRARSELAPAPKDTNPNRYRVVMPSVESLAATLLGNSVMVYSELSTAYDVMLNQTCLEANQNKYYTIQLLRHKQYNKYYVWFRWGRIGDKGIHSLKECGTDLAWAKFLFEDKFLKKTGNQWADREKFTQCPGKYHMVKRDHCEQEGSSYFETLLARAEKNDVKCQVPPSLQRLIRFILGVKAMEKRVLGMNLDSPNMPLGLLKQEQIDAGYKALWRIEDCIGNKAPNSELMSSCNEFYTLIPHSFCCRHRPVLIETDDQVQNKVQLLQTLEDIRKAMAVYNSLLDSQTVHPYDRLYASLCCKITEVSPANRDRKLIELAIKNTHWESHRSFKMIVEDVFRVRRPSEHQHFISRGNHKMLWHGSLASNFTGILSEGLCIAPAHVTGNGEMFGKGVYFTDSASKGANFCGVRDGSAEGVLALCEVSLGAEFVQQNANSSITSPPQGKHSVKGQGSFSPDPAGDVIMSNGATLACGKLVENEEVDSDLVYNEYVVYDTKQIKLHFLVKVKFHDEPN